MKVLFIGDSITDMGRSRDAALPEVFSYGSGYVFFAAAGLKSEAPDTVVVNRGVSGNRSVDIYARLKGDVWNEEPDVVSILVGVNDVWHRDWNNGVDLRRYEKVYRMTIEETQENLPSAKIMVCEPFFLHGTETDARYEMFCEVKKYAAVVRELSEEYHLTFVPLQEAFDAEAARIGADKLLYDGVHPAVLGAKLIADNWLKVYNKEVRGKLK